MPELTADKDELDSRPPSEIGPPEFTLSAVELSTAFQQQEDEAKARYDRKVVEVHGLISGRNDDMGMPIIELKGMPIDKSQDRLLTDPTVMFCFEQRIKGLHDLTIGQEAVIQGICTGKVGHLVGVHEARIIRLGDPLPIQVMSAEQLTSEYRANEAAADEKFGWKEVTLDGVIVAFHHDDEDDRSHVTGVTLAGCFDNEPYPLRVYCRFAPAHWRDLVGLKVGQTVRAARGLSARDSGRRDRILHLRNSPAQAGCAIVCPRSPAGRQGGSAYSTNVSAEPAAATCPTIARRPAIGVR